MQAHSNASEYMPLLLLLVALLEASGSASSLALHLYGRSSASDAFVSGIRAVAHQERGDLIHNMLH